MWIVEDDDTVREYAVSAIQSRGHTVRTFLRPDEVLAAISKAVPPPDVLLTDLVMPGMDGTELAARTAALLPHCRVLVMSGYLRKRSGPSGLPAETDYIQKPFSIYELTAAVDRALHRARSLSPHPGSHGA